MSRYLFLFLFLASPVHAEGYLNPEFSGKKFRTILVTTPVLDINFREQMERATIKFLHKHGGSVGIASLTLFPPFLDVTDAEYKNKTSVSGNDAVLAIEPSDTMRSYPPNYKSNSKTFSMGYVSTKRDRRLDTTITLYDVTSGKVVWIGSIGLNEDGDDLIEETSQKIAQNLFTAGLLVEKKKPE